MSPPKGFAGRRQIGQGRFSGKAGFNLGNQASGFGFRGSAKVRAIGRASRPAARCVPSISAECRTPAFAVAFFQKPLSGRCVWSAQPAPSASAWARGSTPERPCKGVSSAHGHDFRREASRHTAICELHGHPPAGAAGPDRDVGTSSGPQCGARGNSGSVKTAHEPKKERAGGPEDLVPPLHSQPAVSSSRTPGAAPKTAWDTPRQTARSCG